MPGVTLAAAPFLGGLCKPLPKRAFQQSTQTSLTALSNPTPGVRENCLAEKHQTLFLYEFSLFHKFFSKIVSLPFKKRDKNVNSLQLNRPVFNTVSYVFLWCTRKENIYFLL